MSDPGFVGNVPPAVPAGTLTNPVAPNAQVPTSIGARMLDNTRETNGAGMMAYSALLMYPPGTVGRAILDAGLGTAPWGNITGNINDQTDLMAQFTIRDNNLAAHEADLANPHQVTKAQVGLTNVDDTADVNKPVSTPQQNALNLKLNVNNPQPTGTLRFPAGSTTVQPALWQAGSNLTVPVAHSFEWDGTDLSITNAAVARKRLAQLAAGTVGAPSVIGSNILVAADLPAVQTLLGLDNQIAYRNLFFNGGMECNILQQAAATTTALYFVDGVQTANGATARLTTQQEATTLFPGYPFCLLSTVTTAGAPAAGDAHYHTIPLEGTFVRKLGFGAAGASSVVVQFLVRSSITGTFALSLRNAAANRSYVTTFTINAANTNELKTFVIPGDTTGTWPTGAAASIQLFVGMAIGSTFQTGTLNAWQAGNFVGATGQTQLTSTNGATFRITALDIRPGTLVLPPEVLPLDLIIPRAQRYFEMSYTYGLTPGSVSADGQIRAYALNTSTLITAQPTNKVQKALAPSGTQINQPVTGVASAVRRVVDGSSVTITGITVGVWGIQQVASAAAFATGEWYEFQYLTNCRL